MKSTLIAFLAVAVFVLAGCSSQSFNKSVSNSGASSTIPAPYQGKTIPSNVNVSAGGNLYRTDCVSCHGESGHGDGPASQALVPPPANLVAISKVYADDFLFWRISTGVDGTAMPAWKGALTESQIWQIIAFIRTLE